MGQSSIRLLFESHNRRGLGHLMRGLNIARDVRFLAPSSDILFYTRSRSIETLGDHHFRYFIEADTQGLSHWHEVVRSFSPDLIVYDTLLPKSQMIESLLPTIRQVYIMRKCKNEKQKKLFMHDFLHLVDLILIPHTPSDFVHELPQQLKTKSFFVGPIVKPPDQDIQNELRLKYRIDQSDFLLTSTVGGGGFEEEADAFFQKVFAIHKRLYPILPNLRHLVFKGPNYKKPLKPQEGMNVFSCEPEMVSLFGISDVVIAEGGYNSVNEIRLVKTPAIFLPSMRNYDDQEERVRSLEKKGLARAFIGESPDQIAKKVVEIISSTSCLRAMRESYKTDHMERGNRQAAERILEVINN